MPPFEELLNMWADEWVVDKLEHQGHEHGSCSRSHGTRRTDLFERNGASSGYDAVAENGADGSIFTVCVKPK